MFKKILLTFIIISFLIIIGSGESEEMYEFTYFHNYSPAYTLIPMPNEVLVNKGEQASIDLYISGLGMIKENKILLRIPPELLDSENPGQIDAGEIVCVGENSSDVEPRLHPKTVDISNMEITLSDCTFMAVVDDTVNIGSMERTQKAPMLLSERDNSEYPPIRIKLNISENAPTGDQYIYLVFTYTDGTKWYQEKEKIKIHVNSFYEQYQAYVLIFIGVIATLVVQFLNKSYTIIKNGCEDDVNNNNKSHN